MTRHQDHPIPFELRLILEQVYTPDGAALWWLSPHKHFGGRAAVDVWLDGRKDDVLAEAESLLGQVAT